MLFPGVVEMLRVPEPSNTSDTSISSTSSKTNGGGASGGSKKKRRWSVCKAKVRAGALKVKALVHSDSSDSGSDSDGSDSGGSGSGTGSGSRGGGAEHESDSGADSGFETVRRPFPLKVHTCVCLPKEENRHAHRVFVHCLG